MTYWKITKSLFCQSAKCDACVHGDGCGESEVLIYNVRDLVKHLSGLKNWYHITVTEVTETNIFKG